LLSEMLIAKLPYIDSDQRMLRIGERTRALAGVRFPPQLAGEATKGNRADWLIRFIGSLSAVEQTMAPRANRDKVPLSGNPLNAKQRPAKSWARNWVCFFKRGSRGDANRQRRAGRFGDERPIGVRGKVLIYRNRRAAR